MLEIKNENWMPLKHVPNWCEANLGKRVHISSAYRWYLRGVRGIKLDTILVGGTRYTSDEKIKRFICATTAAADAGSINRQPSQATLDKSISYLKKEGLL